MAALKITIEHEDRIVSLYQDDCNNIQQALYLITCALKAIGFLEVTINEGLEDLVDGLKD